MPMIVRPLTADELRISILQMATATAEMLRAAREAFIQPSPTAPRVLARITRQESALEINERRLSDRVALQLRESPWTLWAAEPLALLPAALEEIGEATGSLAGCVETIQREGIPFSESALVEILWLFDAGIGLVTGVAVALRTRDRKLLPKLQTSCAAFRSRCDAAAFEREERLLQGAWAPRPSGVFLRMLDHFQDIEHAVRRMATDLDRALATEWND
jgi:Na+/phosphate symporter